MVTAKTKSLREHRVPRSVLSFYVVYGVAVVGYRHMIVGHRPTIPSYAAGITILLTV